MDEYVTEADKGGSYKLGDARYTIEEIIPAGNTPVVIVLRVVEEESGQTSIHAFHKGAWLLDYEPPRTSLETIVSRLPDSEAHVTFRRSNRDGLFIIVGKDGSDAGNIVLVDPAQVKEALSRMGVV